MSADGERVADLAIGIAVGEGSDLVRRLAEIAGSRARLEAARNALVARLERRSDDVEASVALQLVTEALALRPPVEDFEAVVGFSPVWGQERKK